jgi:phosphatidylglycerophosphate synthase
MFTLDEVKLRARRSNNDGNKRLHFFASHFSIYFSWIFLNLRLSANAVTGVFFVTGLCGVILFSYNDPVFVIIAYSLWRLHIIFDICDGEVARFTQKFSINGAYWDYMIHSILYPATYISILFSLYIKFSDVNFLYLGMVGSILISQILAVKNNYYRAMLFNGNKLNIKKSSNKRGALWSYIVILLTTFLGFEGFLFIYTMSLLFDLSSLFYLLFVMFYLVSLSLQTFIKFVLFSRKGFYERKS